MVKARFTHENGALTMTMRGHAGFAQLGKDPVCAGASVLAMTVAQAVKAMGESGKLRKQPHIIIRNGRVSVTAKPKAAYMPEAAHVFYMGEVGMQLLQEAYPEYAELTPFAPPETAGNIQQDRPLDGQEDTA